MNWKSLVLVIAVASIASCAGDDSAFLEPEQSTGSDPTITDTQAPGDSAKNDNGTGPADWLVEKSGYCDNPQNQVYVRKVKDGDTILLKQLVDGSDTVRYIGVDASEIFKDECYAAEAKSALMSLIPQGKPLCLVRDTKQESKDMYGRLLRYVYMHDGQQWVQQNARLVRMGQARAYHKFLKGTDYQWEILDAENKAYTEKRGGWTDCDW